MAVGEPVATGPGSRWRTSWKRRAVGRGWGRGILLSNSAWPWRATHGHENREDAADSGCQRSRPAGNVPKPWHVFIHDGNESAGCPAVRPSVEDTCYSCEHSTAAAGVRLCDWRWAFVFSGSFLGRVG